MNAEPRTQTAFSLTQALKEDWRGFGPSSLMFVSISVPSMESVHADFAMSLAGMISFLNARPPVKDFRMNLRNERGSLISMQRENLVLAAKKEGATHILFLDSDMGFPPDLLHKLIARQKAMVACNYVKRIIPAMPNTTGLSGRLVATNPEDTGLIEAESTGLGACLVSMEVFDSTPRPWFDTVWLDNGEMIGEDVFFFRKVRHHAGYRLWVDHDASQNIAHIGTFEYRNHLAGVTWQEANDEELKKQVMEA